MSRVLVIGIDGGDPQLLEAWKDKLPNFHRLIKKGTYGTLESTIPSTSCPAWNSLATGKNPGKLGVYGWVDVDAAGYPRVSNWHIFNGFTLYELLSQVGKRVGLVNIPLSYPPRRLNGFVVSGWPAPGGTRNYAWPPELVGEINRLVKGYTIEPKFVTPRFARGREKAFLKNIEKHTEEVFTVTKYMMERHPWDFFMVVFISPDRVQHEMWHFMDSNHPLHRPDSELSLMNGILDTYRKLDEILGALLTLIDEDTYVLTLSDHGFGPFHGHFMMNNWLQQQGLLVLKSGKRRKGNLDLLSKILDRKSSSSDVVRKLLSRTGLFELGKRLAIRFPRLVELQVLTMRPEEDLFNSIDWAKTKAVAWGTDNKIYINSRGLANGEYETLRNQIIDSLYTIEHPVTGEKVITEVFTPEQLYGRNRLGRPPDIQYVIADHKYTQSTDIGSSSLWRMSHRSGWHRTDGLIILNGPAIREGAKISGRIIDVAPTILHMFGLPIPKDMDGGMLKEVFEEGSELATREARYVEVDEERRIKQKIKGLKDSGRI